MPGSFLLDTNIAVALLAGEDVVRASLNHAQQYDLTLVTRDAHFSAIEGIRIEAW